MSVVIIRMERWGVASGETGDVKAIINSWKASLLGWVMDSELMGYMRVGGIAQGPGRQDQAQWWWGENLVGRHPLTACSIRRMDPSIHFEVLHHDGLGEKKSSERSTTDSEQRPSTL